MSKKPITKVTIVLSIPKTIMSGLGILTDEVNKTEVIPVTKNAIAAKLLAEKIRTNVKELGEQLAT